MKIELVASTAIQRLPDEIASTPFGQRFLKDWADGTETHADLLAEFAGRECYQAWNMPNPNTATNEGYLANIIDHNHTSVFEHATASVRIAGVPRSLSQQLERHRHLSPSELSQRFVDAEDLKLEIIVPPLFRDDPKAVRALRRADKQAKREYRRLVEIAIKGGATRKQAREAARYVLPQVETRLVITGNMRAWRDVLHKRYSTDADAEIRELATEVLRQLREIAPNSFQDFPSEPFGVSA